jgi:hypothetical protein
MSRATTSAPAAAIARQCDRPCPRAAPVTSATRPVRSGATPAPRPSAPGIAHLLGEPIGSWMPLAEPAGTDQLRSTVHRRPQASWLQISSRRISDEVTACMGVRGGPTCASRTRAASLASAGRRCWRPRRRGSSRPDGPRAATAGSPRRRSSGTSARTAGRRHPTTPTHTGPTRVPGGNEWPPTCAPHCASSCSGRRHLRRRMPSR